VRIVGNPSKSRGYRTVVDSLDFRVVESPVGDVLVDLEWLVSVTMPLSFEVRWLLLSDEPDGIGIAGDVVV
jgi:hypothetical protein